MNKKLISILIIFCLLCVGLTSFSSANTTVVEEADIDSNDNNVIYDTIEKPKTIDEDEEIIQEEVNENSTVNDENVTTGSSGINEKDYNDVVVPSNPEDLKKFNILMNFNTPEMLNKFADVLSVTDNETFSEVIAVLRADERDNLFKALGNLNQKDLDVFFDIFLIMYDDAYKTDNETDGNDLEDINSIVTEPNKISINNGNSYSKIGNHIIASNSKIKYPKHTIYNKRTANNDKDIDDDIYLYKGTPYTLYGFITHLIDLYENGEISLNEFLNTLKEYEIDTSKIVVNDDGSMQWGYVHIFEPIDDNTIDDSENSQTNSTSENINSELPAIPVESDSVESNDDSSNINITA